MKHIFSGRIPRTMLALVAAICMVVLSFAGTASPVTVFVGNASELSGALDDARTSGDATIIYLTAGTSTIDLSGSTISIPANVTLDLSTSSGTLTVGSGGVLDVSGSISGGAISVSGGTLVREGGSNITATITTSGGGAVRGARVLSLENLNVSSGETITSITYAGESSADTSSYVTRAATGVVYVKLAGTNYSSYQTIETVMTDAGHIFRLGTKYNDTLSLAYSLTYGGLTGATLDELNPTSYTASDAAILLNNPAKDGFAFVGWTCDALGVTVPTDEMVIPEGTTGELTFIAMWMEAPGTGGGKTSGSVSSSSSSTTEDAATQQEAAAAAEQATTTQSVRRTRTASSSTKVNFTSEVEAVMPTIATVRGNSFPWGWVFGGLGALGIAAYAIARRVNRKNNSAE